ncbi:MAG: hypothetical protein GDA48_08630 [Hormoscilla sp. GM102CHS1]|nr:hypothetical protein [Hormoscilla sp. GM102CHS1]
MGYVRGAFRWVPGVSAAAAQQLALRNQDKGWVSNLIAAMLRPYNGIVFPYPLTLAGNERLVNAHIN